jgi:type IV secretory pathway TrbF-like protein
MSDGIATGESAVYQAGRRHWNEAWGSLVSRERWWRWIALASVLSSCGLGWACVYQTSQSHVEVLVHNVDKIGRTVSVEQLGPQPPTNPMQIRSQIQDFVTYIRTVYTDPRAVLHNVTLAYGWIDAKSDAKEQLDEWFIAHNPNERAKDETVGVTVTSVGQIGADTWQCDWSEEHFAKGKAAPTTDYWRITLKLKIDPPKTDAAALINPNGMWVTWLHVTPRITQ